MWTKWLLAAADEPGFSVGISKGGLLIEIARECGAAPGRPEAFSEMLEEFGLLVAARRGE